MQNDVVLKFSVPSGKPGRKPSRSMIAALQTLCAATELRGLAEDAHAHGRKLVLQVFQSADGSPILIHLGYQKA